MSPALEILAHHSEAVDPTLVGWMRDQVDRVIGVDSIAIVAVLGVVILLFPIGLLLLAWRQRRGTQHARKS